MAYNLHSLCPYRTYEMELRLDDPKSKEDDMGVILVDVCLMFRDATIKKAPVRGFLIKSYSIVKLSVREAHTTGRAGSVH